MIDKKKRQLVIFAKAPIPGKVKTRLSAVVGPTAAARIQTEMLSRIISEVSWNGQWALRLSVSPDEAANDSSLWPSGISLEQQGSGDLGQRMGRILAKASPEAPVILVGSDIPEIKQEHIIRAFEALRKVSLVFGPTRDGGFWLVGAAAPPPQKLFEGVRWSSPNALMDCVIRAKPIVPKFVDTLEDVDDALSYFRWRGSSPLS